MKSLVKLDILYVIEYYIHSVHFNIFKFTINARTSVQIRVTNLADLKVFVAFNIIYNSTI